MPKAYWWVGMPNMGDLLTPLLLSWFADISPRWAPVEEADVVVVGSVLEHIPAHWNGIVAGAGIMYPNTDIYLPDATVLALRGPLTAQKFPRSHRMALGDPGLLVSDMVQPVEKKYNLGLVPHWSDPELETRPEFLRYNPRIIRPSGDPIEVIREIARCRKIVSSSLHGIIIADAFEIPRRTETCKQFNKEGGMTKFEDHDRAVGLTEFKVGVAQEPLRYRVEQRQHELYDVLKTVGRSLMGLS